MDSLNRTQTLEGPPKRPRLLRPLGEFCKNALSEWPVWWRNLSVTQKILPAVLITIYWGSLAALGGFRSDHLNLGVAILALSYGGPKARVLLRFLMPLILTGIVYDSQRFYSDFIRGPIRVEEPYLFDKYFFGIPTANGVLTPNEWWQLHTHPVLDIITGFFYLFFIAIFVLMAAYFTFWLSRKGSGKLPALEVARRAPRMMWSFFWLNVLGYSTYYWYAAAPPWYVAKYGLGPARLEVAPSQAGCVRFDEILGTHFFSEMYGRSADVFGAIPSLHVAYPFLAIYYAFQFGSLRTFSVLYYVIMCFSAVYLNHHYILDILWGTFYALVIGLIMDRIQEWRDSKSRAVLQADGTPVT